MAAILTIAALLAVSIAPGELRPKTGYGGILEHFAAYAMAAVMVRLAFPRLGLVAVVAGAASFAAAAEVAQIFIASRTAALSDAVASGAGALVGGLYVWLVQAGVRAYRRRAGYGGRKRVIVTGDRRAR